MRKTMAVFAALSIMLVACGDDGGEGGTDTTGAGETDTTVADTMTETTMTGTTTAG